GLVLAAPKSGPREGMRFPAVCRGGKVVLIAGGHRRLLPARRARLPSITIFSLCWSRCAATLRVRATCPSCLRSAPLRGRGWPHRGRPLPGKVNPKSPVWRDSGRPSPTAWAPPPPWPFLCPAQPPFHPAHPCPRPGGLAVVPFPPRLHADRAAGGHSHHRR